MTHNWWGTSKRLVKAKKTLYSVGCIFPSISVSHVFSSPATEKQSGTASPQTLSQGRRLALPPLDTSAL